MYCVEVHSLSATRPAGWRAGRRRGTAPGRTLLGGLSALLLCGLLLVACFAPRLAPYDPAYCHLNTQGGLMRLQAPTRTFLLGTDARGRDVLSRMIYGARVVLLVGGGAVVIGMGLGLLVGLLAGTWEGRLDAGLQCLGEALMALPGLVLALAVLSLYGQSLRNVILVLGLVIAPGAARVVRGTVLVSKQQSYVEAARAAGASSGLIFVRHLLPAVWPPVLGLASAWGAQAIVLEAALSFVGFGTPPPMPTWGGMMSGAGRRGWESTPYLALFPGLMLSLVVLALYLCGEVLQDLLASRLHGLKAVRTMKG
ncbi:MAG: ABC transporter permease [Candidatus Tectimicrobiota bacterium]